MSGIGLIFCLVTGPLIAWIGPLAFTAVSQFALIANYSEPLTWPTRPPADRGGWIAAMVVFAAGLIAFTIGVPGSARRVSYASAGATTWCRRQEGTPGPGRSGGIGVAGCRRGPDQRAGTASTASASA